MREPPLILVVDDVPDNVEILQLRLESQGYAVITAGDGEAALAIIRDRLPDLVLLDIQMPKLDGIETVKQLKADDSLPFIPVIMVTWRTSAINSSTSRIIPRGKDMKTIPSSTRPFQTN